MRKNRKSNKDRKLFSEALKADPFNDIPGIRDNLK
jgi:hypothetical protein